jgi:hypothetical protein
MRDNKDDLWCADTKGTAGQTMVRVPAQRTAQVREQLAFTQQQEARLQAVQNLFDPKAHFAHPTVSCHCQDCESRRKGNSLK